MSESREAIAGPASILRPTQPAPGSASTTNFATDHSRKARIPFTEYFPQVWLIPNHRYSACGWAIPSRILRCFSILHYSGFPGSATPQPTRARCRPNPVGSELLAVTQLDDPSQRPTQLGRANV